MRKREIASYEEAVQYLLDTPKFTSKNTPDDTKAFLARMGHPECAGRIIHVAGTNGKGSVCTYLSKILEAAGHRVCLFTSPHLVDIRERFLMDGKMPEKEEFLAAFFTVYNLLDWDEREEIEYHPSFFEYLFFMALILFEKADGDFWILETGLGGRLDATNSVDKKELSVITHMGLDHTEYLGETLPEIAAEKAGIMKKNTPVVYWDGEEDATRVFERFAENLQIPAYKVSNRDYKFLNFKNKSIDFSYFSLYYDSVRLRLNTIAEYQMENATLALRAAEVLLPAGALKPEMIRDAIEHAFWAGRMEEIFPEVYVDGAHNEDGIEAFLRTVSGDNWQGRRHLFFGVVADKAYEEMIGRIVMSGLFDEISVIQIRGSRALNVEDIKQVFRHYTDKPIQSFSSVSKVVDALKQERDEDIRIYVVGSLYLVGEIKEFI